MKIDMPIQSEEIGEIYGWKFLLTKDNVPRIVISNRNTIDAASRPTYLNLGAPINDKGNYLEVGEWTGRLGTLDEPTRAATYREFCETISAEIEYHLPTYEQVNEILKGLYTKPLHFCK